MPTRFILRQPEHGGDIRRVMVNGRIVGSIIFARHELLEVWRWHIHAIVSDPPGRLTNSGTSATMDQALADWRRTWEAIEAGPHAWVGRYEEASKRPIEAS